VPAEDFGVDIAMNDGHTVISVRGELDMATAPGLWEKLAQALPQVRGDLIIDLAETRFIDSTGMGVFVRAFKRLQQGGARLVLRSPNNTTRKVIELTGLGSVLVVED
jgi:anti-sigma B factor antagonist